MTDDARIDELSRRTGEALKNHGWMLATAESCTGGWVAQAVTAVAGSSEWFDRGFVTYSNEAKTEMLGVPESTIRDHGAVSEETARAMASGALARSRAGVAVSITGVAGPSGGSPRNPVGTVCFAWAARDLLRSGRMHFAGDRNAVRRQSVVHALEGVLALVDTP